MPRGYLKHAKEAGKKKARGGSSGQGYGTENWERTPPRNRNAAEDFVATANTKSSPVKKEPIHHIGECSICLKECPLVCLSTKCKWHDAACQQCLHRVYVTNAQKSAKNYPLTCFHPLCDQAVHAAQLEKHDIFATADEAKKHRDMLVHSKINKIDWMRTVYCPKCVTPRGIGKNEIGDKDKIFGCRNCKSFYQVSPYYATFRALERLEEDEVGGNYGWARCPNKECGIIISKGEGCFHMECTYCNTEFDWDEVQEDKEKILHAIVPDKEIYLWW